MQLTWHTQKGREEFKINEPSVNLRILNENRLKLKQKYEKVGKHAE